jgi:hypothetical protein
MHGKTTIKKKRYLYVKTFSWQQSLDGTQQQVYWANNNENQLVWTLPNVVSISLTCTRLPASFTQTVNHKTEHLHPSNIKFCLHLEKKTTLYISLNTILTYKHFIFQKHNLNAYHNLQPVQLLILSYSIMEQKKCSPVIPIFVKNVRYS